MTLQRSPYLRNQRNFPYESIKMLSNEMDRAYIDIATKVNDRTIGIFALNTTTVTGEQWYLQGTRKQQTLREVYEFGNIAPGGFTNIIHGIDLSQISGFVKIYGTFVDFNGFWYPLPFVSVIATANQINIFLDNTNIIINAGAASTGTSSGFVVLEWISITDTNT